MKEQNNIPEVVLYSDWWAVPNPGKWGYGVILCYRNIKKEFYKGYTNTTNNRMELTWVIVWLSKLKTKSKVQVFTDSQYTINWIEKWWALKWKSNDWYRTKTEKAVNYDLWEKLLALVSKHEVKFNWVKWHNWHEENERCDELATLALEGDKLLLDKWFIPSKKEKSSSQITLEDNQNKESILNVLWKWNKNMKVEKTWDPCKKCLTPVIKKKPKHTKKTLEKKFFYEYFFTCPCCKTNYMTNDAKREIKELKI